MHESVCESERVCERKRMHERECMSVYVYVYVREYASMIIYEYI